LRQRNTGAARSGLTSLCFKRYAARALAAQVSEARLAEGAIYPPLSEIREVSAEIALAVAEQAYAAGLALLPRPDDLDEYIRAQIYEPSYGAAAPSAMPE